MLSVNRDRNDFNNSDRGCIAILKRRGDMILTRNLDLGWIWDDKKLIWKEKSSYQMFDYISDVLLAELEKFYASFKKKIDVSNMGYADKDKSTKELEKWYYDKLKRYQDSTALTKILRFAGSLIDDCEKEGHSRFDADPNIIPIAGGLVVDCRTGETRPRVKEDYCTIFLNVNMSNHYKDVEKFMRQYAHSESSLLRLQEILGYCITRWTFAKRFFLFPGPEGDNGKSTLINVVKSVFEPYSVEISEKVFAVSHGSAATPELCVLANNKARLGIHGETSGLANLKNDLVKKLTGEDKIPMRKNYGNPFDTYVKTKLLLVGNELPQWSHEKALERRICIFAFTNKFVQNPNPKDKTEHKMNIDLVNKITDKCKDQLLKWLVDGAVRVYSRRNCRDGLFSSCPVSDNYHNNYVKEMNTAQVFVNDVLEVSTSWASKNEVLQWYANWVTTTMAGKQNRRGDLWRMIEERGFMKTRRGAQGGDGYFVQMKSDDAMPPDFDGQAEEHYKKKIKEGIRRKLEMEYEEKLNAKMEEFKKQLTLSQVIDNMQKENEKLFNEMKKIIQQNDYEENYEEAEIDDQDVKDLCLDF